MFQIPKHMVLSVMIGRTGELLLLRHVVQTVKTQEHVSATAVVQLKQELIQTDPLISMNG